MMKKRLLSLILAGVMLAATACAGKTDSGADTTTGTEALTTVFTDITAPDESSDTASADLSKYSVWLGDRLSATADGNTVTTESGTVALAIGESMGIETTGLRDEGYIIKTVGNDTVIVAATETGLDAGVHKFAIEAEKADSTNINITSGLKIGKITLGGADIKGYKILLPMAAEGDTIFAASATRAMETAANELVKYTRLATGITLPIEYVVGLHEMTDEEIKSVYGCAIVLLSDPTAKSGSRFEGEVGELGTEDNHLTVNDGIMRIVGGNQRGCIYGVYDFLENHMGWRFLTGDVEYLYDADELIIDDVDEYTKPTFDYRGGDFPGGKTKNGFIKLKHNSFNAFSYPYSSKYGYGFGSEMYHGHSFEYQIPDGMKGSSAHDQPCLSDEETLQVVIESMCTLLDERQGDPWNRKPGYDLMQIACSMNDNTNYCKCNDCMKEVRRTSFSDLYFNFVNEAAKVIGKRYPGILVNTVAYNTARAVPKEVVLEPNVSVYYCMQGCNQHSICDGKCADYPLTTYKGENITEKENLDAWVKACDYVYIWHYTTSFISPLSPCPNVYELYEDVTYCASIGVKGFYADGDHDHNFENLKAYLLYKLNYNADITREEFEALIDEYITIVYGEDAAPYIREYLDMHQQSGEAVNGCFTNNFHYPFDMMDIRYYRNNYETMRSLFDNAELYAKDSVAEKKIVKLRLHMELLGLTATYDRDYVAGTAESRAEFEKRYKWVVDTANKYKSEIEMSNADDWPTTYELTKYPLLHFFKDDYTMLSSDEGRA